MKQINYKSDFDFILRLCDSNGTAVGWPSYDWKARFWTSQKVNAFEASCIGGLCKNCFNDNGQIHIVADSHNLSAGVLNVEFIVELPNEIYFDGTEKVVHPLPLEVELIRGAATCPESFEVEVMLPYIYRSAYDDAVAAGYDGAINDYYSMVSQLPQTVATADSINQSVEDLRLLVSDFGDGKRMIADALTAQGEQTDVTESFSAMADKIYGLQLAVEGEPCYVNASTLASSYDLYNEMYNNQRAEFPYMYAVAVGVPTVTLSGADAYLCSDGYFTTESGIHTFASAGEHYVIYYNRTKEFHVGFTAANTIYRMCVFNGTPIMVSSNARVNSIIVYGDEKYSRENASELYITAQLLTNLTFANLESSGGVIAADCNSLIELWLPKLRTMTGGYIVTRCPALTELTLPALESSNGAIAESCQALTELSLPVLKQHTSDRKIASGCNRLTRLSLPALTVLDGNNNGGIVNACSSLAELFLPALEYAGTPIAYNCSALQKIELPVLQTYNNAQGVTGCPSLVRLSLPALTTLLGGFLVVTCSSLIELSLPALTTVNGVIVSGCDSLERLSLPALTTQIETHIATDCNSLTELSLPELATQGSGYACVLLANSADYKDVHIYLPKLIAGGKITYSNKNLHSRIHVHFGSQQDFDSTNVLNTNYSLTEQSAKTIVEVTIEEGFVCSLNVSRNALTVENLRLILRNLGDNTGHLTKTITFGSEKLSQLTDEEISEATNKNYTLI